MNKRCLTAILTLTLCLALVFSFAVGTGADDGGRTYPVMQPDEETREEWIEAYNSAPLVEIETEGFRAPSFGGSVDLLSHLQYTPSQRDQGWCPNCWAWAGTGVLGIALDVEEGIKDRLSVQYINSCQFGEIAKTCCTGGWLYDLTDFYAATRMAVPWSNTNAQWQDGDSSCDTSCGSINTTPNYTIACIDEATIPTQGVGGGEGMGNPTAIANIKSVLQQDRAVWFGFFLPNSAAWNSFTSFWSSSNESAVYDIDQFCGTTYTNGVGHAVLCVGYNDDDPGNSYWIMLNSWGTTSGRPNGLFRINMDMNYDCTNPGIGNGDYSFYWQTLDVVFNVTVGIDAPDGVIEGSDFVARVNVTEVVDFDSCQFHLSYNASVIEVIGVESGPQGVTAGMIDSTPVPVALWGFQPPGTQGTILVQGNVPGVLGVTGSGYLAEIHFNVVGSPAHSSNITLSEGTLFNNSGLPGPAGEIPVSAWLGASVQVVAGATVSIVAPADVVAGGNFSARVNTSELANFDSYALDVSYNASVLEVIGAEGGPQGVTAGMIDSTTVPIDSWAFSPPGTPGMINVTGSIPGGAGVNGSGYLAEIHFHVTGSPGDSSNITPSSANLTDTTGGEIPVWGLLGDSVEVVAGPTVTIVAPAEAAHCSNFSVSVNVSAVTNFDSYGLDVSYNASVIEVVGAEGGPQGVTAGMIDSTTVPIDSWEFSPPGTPGAISLAGNITGGAGATGSGYLAEIHFHAIGLPGESSNITPSNGSLRDTAGEEIPVLEWLGDSVQVSPGVVVSIEAPAEAPYCSNITARVNIADVTGMDSYQFNLSYNTSVLEVIGVEMGPQGVTAGMIDSTTVPVDMWNFQPPGTPGTIMVLGNLPGIFGVSGDGYLCEVHFHVVGSACNSSNLTLSGGMLFDSFGTEIPVAAWIGGSVHVSSGVTVTGCGADPNPTKVGHNTTFSTNATGGTTPYAWEWDFGDGSANSSAESPTYAYTAADIYTVTVTVTDSEEAQGSCSFNITVNEALAVSCDATPKLTKVDHAVNFTCTPSGGVPGYDFYWDFGDSSGTSTEQNPGYAYSVNGTYQACVNVTDSLGNDEGCCVNITVNPALNVAGCMADPNPTKVGHNTTFSANATGGVGAYTWDWDFGDGNNSSAASPTWAYAAADNYTVTVNVTDGLDNREECSFNITVNLELAVSGCMAAPNPTEVGHNTTFSANATGGVGAYTWDWHFGDGNSSAAASPTWAYAAADNYTVAVTVRDGLNNTEECSFNITVNEALAANFSASSGIVRAYPDPAVDPPTAYNTSGYVNVTAFNFTNESTGGVPPYGYDWGFGDGNNSTDVNPGHSYAVNGTYDIALTVTDSILDSDTETKVEYIMVYKAGDANANGVIDMADVTKVERIILRIDPPTIWADANQNGVIDMADVTTIEWMILGVG